MRDRPEVIAKYGFRSRPFITNSEPPVCGWWVARVCGSSPLQLTLFYSVYDSMNFIRTAARRYSTMNASKLSLDCSPFTQAVVTSMRKL